ncbi:hypothetical protein [Acidicapsa acidisoli]|uniref:hypothetical protein n=1 Tax=Acidicapsa acidisoli TaxID=1615681 RepID=UPI0021DFEBD3|nr:hypothetical protein [Acidicapsa acidisoli]
MTIRKVTSAAAIFNTGLARIGFLWQMAKPSVNDNSSYSVRLIAEGPSTVGKPKERPHIAEIGVYDEPA